ncbi:ubiquitin-like protein 3 isoform X1 [Cephus cinctus]|uniref:Ubiquitin-like protein 3 n=1 Tax=Cephus cinctus TaxID=211228 RepID=A0AAJ7C589_CEPCN|nr:ubiquitin-like protein 3 isoform X1 [Cephus cinctus]
MSSRNIPSDKINLRLILVSGKTKEFLFSPSDSAGDIAQHVFENWPEDWVEEAVAKAEILRLIYQGRFLHSNVTLGALGLPFGKTTVMHLVPRENLPEPNSQGLLPNGERKAEENTRRDSFTDRQKPGCDFGTLQKKDIRLESGRSFWVKVTDKEGIPLVLRDLEN